MKFKLRELRNRTGKEMTQRQLAEKSGVSLCTVTYLENGRRKTASFEIISKLAKALEVSIEELIAE